MRFVITLKRALLLNFVLAAALPTCILAVLTLTYVRDYLLDEVVRDNRFLVNELKGDTEVFLQEPVQVLGHIRDLLVADRVPGVGSLDDYLEHEVRRSGLFESIYLLDETGRVAHLGVSKKLEQQKRDYYAIDLSSHELFSRPGRTGEVGWSDTFISVVTGEPSITVGVKVHDRTLVGNVSLANLNRIVSRLNRLKDLSFAIIDRKGILIAHSDPEMALQRVSMMFHPEVVRALETGTEEPLHVHEDSSLLESVARIPGTGWVVWVARTREVVLSPVENVQNFMVYTLLVSLVVGSVLALVNSRKVMSPMTALVASMRRLADGDYDVDLPKKSYSELDELAAGFRLMATAVSDRENSIVEREQRFRNLVNSIEGIVWEFDLKTNRFVFVSHHCEEILGCSYRQWLDSPDFWKTHIHPDDRQWVSDYLKGLSQGNLSPQFEFRMINSDGILLWVRNMVNLVYDNDTPSRLYGVIFDITERKISEISLRDSEIRFRSLVEQAADAIFIHDQYGRLFEVNEQACRSLGYSRDELLGLSVEDIDVSHDPVQLVSLWNSVRHGETVTLDGEHRRKDGTVFPVEVRLGSFTFEDRPLFLALARDVTERRQAEAALRESEERFRNYFELGLIGMSLRSRDGSFIQFNDRLCEIVGYEREELARKTWVDITHPDDVEESRQKMEQLLAGQFRRLSMEKRYIHKSGKTVHVSISAVGIRNADGVIDQTFAIADDITQRKKAEQALKESEEQFRLLLNSTAEGIYGTDTDGNCTFCNPAGLAMLGFGSEDDLLGRNMHEVIHHSTPEGRPLTAEDSPISIANMHPGTTISKEDIFWRKDGSWFHVEYFGHPIVKDGELLGMVVTFHDITERKQLQQQHIRTAQLASLGELAAGVAHEINNPINGVINYAQILINRLQKSGLETELAERIMKEGERIAVIVRDLLFFAREGGPEVKVADAGEVLSEALSLTEAQIRKEGILLKIDSEENLPRISTRAQQIQQLLLNVLSNSRHALNEKFPLRDERKIIEISMRAVTRRNREYVQFKIRDHGIGIPAALLEKVMNPFVTTKPAGVGTGLGLSISHEIVENHSGDIRIESIEGEWTEVTIELPATDRNRE